MARKIIAFSLLLFHVFFLTQCKQWFEALSEPLSETYSHIILPKTGQTQVYIAGDDGHYQMGAAWPSPRFIDNNDGTVTDRLTGLMWEKTSASNHFKWNNAITSRIAALNSSALGGYRDWRLPNIHELYSLVNFSDRNTAGWLAGQGINSNIAGVHHLSSTSGENSVYTSYFPTNSYLNYFPLGNTYDFCVLAVRGNGKNGFVKLPQTGQTTSSQPGDDGYYRMGIAWPSPRFIDNGNGTITDRLTGLIWQQDGGNLSNKWEDAFKKIAEMNSTVKTGGYTDWRMPNINELRSLINYHYDKNQDVWLTNQGFKNLPSTQDTYYYSSTSIDNNCWSLCINSSNSPDTILINSTVGKDMPGYVIAVRGGYR